MEKVEISLNNTVLANVWQYLYDRVKSMNHKVIEYSKFLENQDGAGYNVTYRCTVQNIQPPQNNQLLVNYTYVIEPEGKDTQVYGILPAIEFTGWQLQLDTVLINIEFLPLFKDFVDGFVKDLNKMFGKKTQPSLTFNQNDFAQTAWFLFTGNGIVIDFPFELLSMAFERTLHSSIRCVTISRNENVAYFNLFEGGTRIIDITLTRNPSGNSLLAITPDEQIDPTVAEKYPGIYLTLGMEEFPLKTKILNFITQVCKWAYDHQNWSVNPKDKEKTPEEILQPRTNETTRTGRGEYLDSLCIRWVSRGYLPGNNMDEFLRENESDSGEYVTKSEFKRVLNDACKRGLIIKEKNRFRPKT